jgi:hypothetical protein
MDEKHPVFDTAILGAIFIACGFLTFCTLHSVMAVDVAKSIFDWVAYKAGGECMDATVAVVRMTAAGVGLSALGRIIQIFSVTYFQRWHFKDGLRREIAQAIWQVAKECKDIPEQVKCRLCRAVSEERQQFDPFFVWVQYSDPQGALREWGKTKSRYMYVGENWLVALCLGYVVGSIAGVVSLCASFPKDDLWLAVLFVPWTLSVLLCKQGLESLISHNREAEKTMVAVYLAAVFCRPLRKTFLRPLVDWRRNVGP